MKFSDALFTVPLVMGMATAAQDTARAEVPGRKLPTVAVVSMTGQGVDSTSALVLSDALSDELHKSGKLRVMERSQMAGVLKEQGFQQSGACDGSECAVQAGRMLGIERVVVGSLGKFGNTYSLSLRGVDVSTGEILVSVHRTQKGEMDAVLTDLLPGVARELASKLTGEKAFDTLAVKKVEPPPPAPALVVAPPPKPAEPPSTPKTTESSSSSKWPWIVGGAVVAGGAATAAILLTGNSNSSSSPSTTTVHAGW